MREALEELVAESATADLPDPCHRDVVLPQLPGKADVVVGMRRVGKTWLLYQQVRALLRAGIPRERILYLDLEDERLAGLRLEHLRLIPESFFRRHPESHGQPCWFFFDEVQVVEGWERFVRRLLDQRSIQVALSGSSARLLSGEIATAMRGRALTTELLPFSFAESLRHAGVDTPVRWPPAGRVRARVENAFSSYLEAGGFPEVQGLASDLRRRVLQSYLDTAMFRDVVERHAVTNIPALRFLVRRLLRSQGSRFSISSIYNDVKSQGLGVAKDTLHEYAGYLEDAYLVFPLPIHARSEKQRAVNPRKLYTIDHGLVRACVQPAGRDAGHHLENLVYLALRRRGEVTGYHVTASGYEVDFRCHDGEGNESLVQVCANLDDRDTAQREMRALEEAIAETGIRDAVVVTLGGSGSVRAAGIDVPIVPAWRWLLQLNEAHEARPTAKSRSTARRSPAKRRPRHGR